MNLGPYLSASAVIDCDHPGIQTLARELAGASAEASAESRAKRCFDWVRDEIEHSVDFGRDEMTCRASDVLAVGTGLCIAKSHLLVALLRANGVAAGFCYQRLASTNPAAPFATHGFVAVWLDGIGWYRCDARGNSKPGIHCEFTPGAENLAFQALREGECLYPEVWAEPWPELVAAMGRLGRMADYYLAPLDLAPPAR
ncbi:MAG TPA: transglutaminase family protein [Janthinobacterium sp.]|nr:transglutaminase family protein [Janthinobacterium sp.]